MFEWANKQQIDLPAKTIEELLPFISAPKDCSNLNQYLECFAIPISLLQTEEALTSAVTELVKHLENQGLVYAEIRFAPQLHTQKGLSQYEVVKAVLSGLNTGLENSKLFRVNLILCCLRGIGSQEANLKTVHVAKQFLTSTEAGVVAIDLAGPEMGYPTKDFSQEFLLHNVIH